MKEVKGIIKDFKCNSEKGTTAVVVEYTAEGVKHQLVEIVQYRESVVEGGVKKRTFKFPVMGSKLIGDEVTIVYDSADQKRDYIKENKI